MEPCAQKTTKKHNPELVDTVFRLMFEILWVAPYDRRRSNAALSGFERCSRETAVLLAATDLRSASPGELQTLLQAVDRRRPGRPGGPAPPRPPRRGCRSAGAGAADRRHRAGARCRCRGLSLLPAPVCCRFVIGLRRAACAESVLRRAGLASNLPCADLLCAESALR